MKTWVLILTLLEGAQLWRPVTEAECLATLTAISQGETVWLEVIGEGYRVMPPAHIAEARCVEVSVEGAAETAG